MTMSKLSPIIDIDGCNSIDEIIEISYRDFKSNIMDKVVRPRLFGKLVFIKFDWWIEHKAEMYWHLASLHEKERFNVFPCGNHISENRCNRNCVYQNRQITLKNGQKRYICVYRAIRVNWINDIIELANKKDISVKEWTKDDKLHLRFQHEDIDYIVIFEIHSKRYQLITAFPVFYINKKMEFDKDYSNYVKSKKPVIALRKLESPSTTW